MLTQIKIDKMNKSPLNFVSAAQLVGAGNQPSFGAGVMGAGLNLYGPNHTMMPGFFENLLTGAANPNPEPSVPVNPNVPQAGDANNASATGIGSVTGATGAGGIGNSGWGSGEPLPPAQFNVGTRPVESPYKPKGSFAAPAQAAATGVFGSQANRQASVGLRPLMNIM